MDHRVLTRIPSRTNQERGKIQHFHVQTVTWRHEEVSFIIVPYVKALSFKIQ